MSGDTLFKRIPCQIDFCSPRSQSCGHSREANTELKNCWRRHTVAAANHSRQHDRSAQELQANHIGGLACATRCGAAGSRPETRPQSTRTFAPESSDRIMNVWASDPSAQTPLPLGLRPAPPKRGRPAKDATPLWTDAAMQELSTIPYATAKPTFHKARNSVEIGAAWILVANILSKSQSRTYTVSQCKEKIKWLRRKWALYREGRSETGNVPRAQDPPCLELMMEHWAPHEGMQNTTLCDAGTTHSDEGDSSRAEGETSSTRTSKRKKTTGESIEHLLTT
ncbi:hypothetical protein, variant 1 [Phytophthora nicotianae]|uniref:Uncharacterized protein n=1 Tax=Phytophthora nicotianae TaxID=4792 RepID=W2GR99_PHYNI|nr:hypothetical protein, variant 1 [Phytophthora nicotianae]